MIFFCERENTEQPEMNINIDRSLIQTEEQFLARWGEYDKPLVSINCITYNHENYIRDALDGFLIQQTDFPFEILIHDDASTDGTADIVREYEKKYPNIIKPIYQTVNQYSQGKRVGILNAQRAQGEYIAFCEGDDYWFDSSKLQVQLEAMQKYPGVDLSFHSAIRIYCDKRDPKQELAWNYKDNFKIFFPDAILETTSQFAPTASYMVRREVIENLPEWVSTAPIGDFFIEMYGAKRGGALYLHKTMSVYRYSLGNKSDSWTAIKFRVLNFNKSFQVGIINSLCLLEKDFSRHLLLIHKRKAYYFYKLALLYLRIKDYDNFRKNILKSETCYPFLSISQEIAYKFSPMPWLLRGFYKVARKILLFYFRQRKQ